MVNAMKPFWMKAKTAAEYADVSERTFREWIKMGLRTAKIGGTVLTNRQWTDDFIKSGERDLNEVDRIADEIVSGLQ